MATVLTGTLSTGPFCDKGIGGERYAQARDPRRAQDG
jgi:hypothetical protein